jgi:hypothetical protein
VKKLNDMLSQWPMAERPQLEADEAAERVVAAIEGGQLPASVDEALLAPPLPKQADEDVRPGSAAPVAARVESKMSKDRTRDRTSFQELAKMASTPPPPTSVAPPSASTAAAVQRGKEAESSDSGIVDLKMIASADPSGEQRAQTTPLAAQGLFEDESAPPKPAIAPAAAAQLASAPPPAAAAVAQAPIAKQVAKPVEEKKGGGGVLVVLGSLVAAAGIAAGVFFYVKHERATHVVATTTVSAPDKAVEQKANATEPTATAAASLAQAETPDQLPEVDPNGKPTGKMLPKIAVHHATTGAATAEPAPALTGATDPKLVANVPTGAAGGNSGDLTEAMKAAAGGGTGLGEGAQSGNLSPTVAQGSVPQRPSQGQVAGAIGNVMPAARACIASGSPMSRATITFQSDGSVKSVSVTGFAAGKPEEACIKGALSKAKVDPFAEATYPMTVSVRAD